MQRKENLHEKSLDRNRKIFRRPEDSAGTDWRTERFSHALYGRGSGKGTSRKTGYPILSEKEFLERLEKSRKQSKDGKGKDVDIAIKEIRKKYSL